VLLKLAAALILLFPAWIAGAQKATSKANFNLHDNVAIDGYDPVAYFDDHKAVEGKKELSLSHEGVVYYFSSATHRDKFKSDPAKYEPAYGGWCAFAMGSSGEKVEVDPETFKIIDGRLYLFYNKFFNNTLTSWNKDEPALKRNADVNWQRYVK
jgi:YHS domain-containing protein